VQEGLPTDRYLKILQEGASEFGLPESYQQQLRDHACEVGPPQKEWKPLSSHQDVFKEIAEADLKKLVEDATDGLVFVFNHFVVYAPKPPNPDEGLYKILATNFVSHTYYYPGISKEEHQLFVEDNLTRRLNLKVLGILKRFEKM